jgi:hypothetical protein
VSNRANPDGECARTPADVTVALAATTPAGRLFPVFARIPAWNRMHWRAWLPLLTVFALPNLVFAAASLFLPSRRAWISIDYLFLALAFCVMRGRRFGLAILTVLLFSMDAIFAFSGIYYFNFGSAIRYLKELPEVSPWVSVPMAVALAAVACGIAWLACAMELRSERRNACWLLAIAGLVLVPYWAAYAVLTGSWVKQGREVLVGSTLASEMAESMILFAPPDMPQRTQSVAFFAAPALAHATPTDAKMASAAGLGGTGSAPRNVLIIVEEALGEPLDAPELTAVLAPLRSAEVKARYNVRFGSVPFSGGTVSGEMRELCDTLLGPADNPEGFLRQCLPWKFRKLGYRTIGVHGYSKRMFDREHWYPQIGFQELLFKEELSAKLKNVCGSTFPGICDTDIAAYLGDLFAAHRSQRLFVHWMTLNSHLPVDDQTASTSQFPCEKFVSSRDSREVCNMVRVQFETNQAIARMLLRPDLPPMTVFLAGDHAPPFLSLKLRALYLQDRVPYLIFEPWQ